jgi:hypothetical protein
VNAPKSADAKKLTLPRVPDGLARKVIWCILALRRVAAAAGVNLQIVGSSRASTDHNGGIQLKVDGSGSTGSNVNPTVIWGIREDFKMTPGSISGLVPSYSGTSISPIGSAVAFPSSGNHTFWLKMTFTIVKDAHGYLTSRSLTSVTIENSAPTESETVKRHQLISCVSGVYTQPQLNGSQSATLCNTAANTTQLTLTRN